MKLLEYIMLLIVLIITSNIISKKIPTISLPLIQVAMGLLVWLFTGINLELESEFFMLLFIAPILYMDGEHISKKELWKYKAPVFLMAIGLVFSTILIVGFGIHLLIPNIPLAACFALAAVLSPTDPIAVKAVFNRAHLPHNIIVIVEGESLINDASGLVAFKFAIAAVLTGMFSIQEAFLSFLYIAFGGIIIGAIAVLIINIIIQELKHMGMDEAPVFTLIQILTPFAVFLLAEELGFSGVLAVVAGGIVHSLHPYNRISAKEASIRYISEGTWTTLLFSLNGLIFLLLGLNLPTAMENAVSSDHIVNLILISYVIIITIALIIIRFVWALIFVATGHSKRFYNSLLIAISGARGTITLAACFSIPMLLDDGTPFPERDLILFLSCGVIIATLLVTNVILPIVSPKPTHESGDAIRIANEKVIQAAIDLLKKEANQHNKLSAYSLISHYEGLLLESETRDKHVHISRSAQNKIILLGLESESRELNRLARTRTYNKDVIDNVGHLNDFLKLRLGKHVILSYIKYTITTLIKPKKHVDPKKIAEVRILTTEAAIKTIEENITPDNEWLSNKILANYKSVLENFTQILLGESGQEYLDIKQELELKAILAQRYMLESMVENGEISHSTANVLRKYIHFAELAMLSGEIIMD